MTAPATSKLLCSRSSRDSGTCRSESRKATMPTGMLTKKIHGHEKRSTRMPPSSRPTAPPPTAIAAHTPIAFVRSAPSANVVVTIESAAGETSAAPKPCSPRATMRNSEDGASPQMSEPTVKTTTPVRKTRLRPMRSPARPPSSRKPPKTSAYAFTIHCRSVLDISRSAWIDGSATLTIVASRMTMNCAMQTRTRTSHGFLGAVMPTTLADHREAARYGYPYLTGQSMRRIPSLGGWTSIRIRRSFPRRDPARAGVEQWRPRSQACSKGWSPARSGATSRR